MKCPGCGKMIPDQSKFCLECGSNISAVSAQSGIEGDVSIGNLKTMIGGAHSAVPVEGEVLTEPTDFSLGNMQTMALPGNGSDRSLQHEPLSNRYELLEEIGRGGFAVVYKATDKKLHRPVAVKKLLKNAGEADLQTIERFKREARVIAGLNHRNIVGVYDVGEDADGIYLVMEYVEGGTLRELLKEKSRLKLSDALRLMRGIVQGLSYAHRKNLVHRDIKPANILLQNDNGELIPKIVDFGLAQAGRDSELSMSGYGMGTPWYMPPEQRRDAKSVNHTADIYALGKTLYEMVTGEIPDNVDPDEIPPPKELADVIFKCIKSKAEERYFSADELLQTLENVEQGVGNTGFSIKNKQSAVANSNTCPACGTENPADVKFCEGCGGGMFRVCPECEKENFVNKQFCGSCGTDVDGFLAAQETLRRMESFAEERKWSRVVKEAKAFNAEIRLPGKRGEELRTTLGKKTADAEQALAEIGRLEFRVDEASNFVGQQQDNGAGSTVYNQFLGLVIALSKLKELSDDQKQLQIDLEKRIADFEKEKSEQIARKKAEAAARRKKKMVRGAIAATGVIVAAVAVDQAVLAARKNAFQKAVEHKQLVEAKAVAERLGSRYNTRGDLELLQKALCAKEDYLQAVNGQSESLAKFGGNDWKNAGQLVVAAEAPGSPLTAIENYSEAGQLVEGIRLRIEHLLKAESGFSSVWSAERTRLKKYVPTEADKIAGELLKVQSLTDPVGGEKAYLSLSASVAKASRLADAEQEKEKAMLAAKGGWDSAIKAVNFPKAEVERYAAKEWGGIQQIAAQAETDKKAMRFEAAKSGYINAVAELKKIITFACAEAGKKEAMLSAKRDWETEKMGCRYTVEEIQRYAAKEWGNVLLLVSQAEVDEKALKFDAAKSGYEKAVAMLNFIISKVTDSKVEPDYYQAVNDAEAALDEVDLSAAAGFLKKAEESGYQNQEKAQALKVRLAALEKEAAYARALKKAEEAEAAGHQNSAYEYYEKALTGGGEDALRNPVLWLKRASQRAEQLSENIHRQALFTGIGGAYEKLGNMEQAGIAYSKAADAFCQIEWSRNFGKGKKTVELIEKLIKTGREKDALKVLEWGSSFALKLKENHGNDACDLAEFAGLYYRLGEKEKCRSLLSESDKLAQEIISENDAGYMHSYLSFEAKYVEVLANAGMYDEALSVCKRNSHHRFDYHRMSGHLSAHLVKLAEKLGETGRVSEAEWCCREAVRRMNEEWLVSVKYNKPSHVDDPLTEDDSWDYNCWPTIRKQICGVAALMHKQEILPNFNEEKDVYVKVRLSLALAEVNQESGDADAAESFRIQAERFARKSPSKKDEAVNLCSVAEHLFRSRLTERANACFDDAENLAGSMLFSSRVKKAMRSYVASSCWDCGNIERSEKVRSKYDNVRLGHTTGRGLSDVFLNCPEDEFFRFSEYNNAYVDRALASALTERLEAGNFNQGLKALEILETRSVSNSLALAWVYCGNTEKVRTILKAYGRATENRSETDKIVTYLIDSGQQESASQIVRDVFDFNKDRVRSLWLVALADRSRDSALLEKSLALYYEYCVQSGRHVTDFFGNGYEFRKSGFYVAFAHSPSKTQRTDFISLIEKGKTEKNDCAESIAILKAADKQYEAALTYFRKAKKERDITLYDAERLADAMFETGDEMECLAFVENNTRPGENSETSVFDAYFVLSTAEKICLPE